MTDFIRYGDVHIPKYLEPRKKPKGWGVWAKCEVELYGPDGEILEKHEAPSRSFLRNLGRFVRNFLLVTSQVNEDLSDTGGVARKPRIISGASLTNENLAIVGTVGQIKFGSGAAAVQSTDFELAGPILNAGNNVTTTLLVEDAVQAQWKHEGQTANNTGSSFVVNEIGLYAVLKDALVANTSRTIMMMRDIVSPGVSVANTLTVLGRYTFTVAV